MGVGPITLVIIWLVGLLASGGCAITLGIVMASAWLRLLLAPRALRRV